MDLKQLSEFTGKSESTIRRALKQLGIESKNGVKQFYTKEQVQSICNILFKNLPLPVKVAIEETFSDDIALACANEKVSVPGDALTKQDIANLVTSTIAATIPVIVQATVKELQKALPDTSVKKTTLGENDFCTLDEYFQYNRGGGRKSWKDRDIKSEAYRICDWNERYGDGTYIAMRTPDGIKYRRKVWDKAIKNLY